MLKTVLQTGEVHNFEAQFIRQDGSLCWVLLSCKLNKAENCLDKVVTDISDRKQALSALRQSEATQRALFQAIPDFTLRMYRDRSDFDIISRGKNYILPKTIERADLSDILPPELVRQRRSAVRQALASQEIQIYEQCMERFGEPTWEEVRVVPRGADDVLVMIRDISARKQAEANLERATQEAQIANQAKSQFLSNMSHELRTPLNVILGFTQLMIRNRDLNSQQQDYLNSINHSSEHLLSLINDILEMSKIEAGKISLNLGDFDLYGLLDGIYLMFQFKASSKALELQLQRAANLPQYIRTDESKLRQILVNLVGNAVKFTESGNITLRASLLSKEPMDNGESRLKLQFEVEDTGHGIEPAEIECLFEPFVQARNNSAHEGTGLGLPISKKFVELMGGEMAVSSQVGRGSQFQFSIRAETVPCSRIATCHENRPVVGLKPGQPNYRILIVEDVPESRQLLIDLLKPIGFELREAENGLEALQIAQQWQPHLVWMDIRMPVMDGYEATQKMKAMGENAPLVIALTSSAFKQEQTLAMNIGFDDFVCKPFRTEIIFEKMAEFLGVEYIYGDSTLANSQSSNEITSGVGVKRITSADLQVMPENWIEKLHQAATKVNGKEVNTLIQEIPSTHAELADYLTRLVENFSFEAIVALTKD
ncbi:ATP-binding protein [Capilliphycus salinus ALCB114379]|uniref:PAS domain-containing hybrid sensor histidine kinase/response regulator n=1 Tax=Capilliphycus salinus TaxID=2768948 RepID=UPI0039A470F3